MIVSFGTKAETLKRLRKLLKQSIVLPQVCFTVEDWQNESLLYLNKIEKDLPSEYPNVIVRSSAYCEDSSTQSFAGHFKSVGNIGRSERSEIRQAIEDVIDSYNSNPLPENQVFVQPFVEDAIMSGVVFTRDLDTLAPYYLVNYNDRTTDTASVTSGQSMDLRTHIKFSGYLSKYQKLTPLFEAIKEIEDALDCDCLDIEFAIDTKGSVYLFQVRRIVHGYVELPTPHSLNHHLRKIYNKFSKLNKSHPYLYGKRTILGVMPDWNPAEIIGIKPRPLALSLYKYLITDRTWAFQRDNYGYKNLRSFPLIISFLGVPYIDVRVSFNSFIPQDLDDFLSNKLVDYYLDSLSANTSLHDKIEFEIIFSCYSFDIDNKFKQLLKLGFTREHLSTFKNSLLNLTNNIVCTDGGVFHQDLEKIEDLKEKQHKILNSNLTTIEKIYWLTEDCCRYGTLPFAGLARAGFIAVQLLRSMVTVGIMTIEEMNSFMASLNTVAPQMANDHAALPLEEFLEKYGHLRPGTYDILSERYDEAYDVYFHETPTSLSRHEFKFEKETLEAINKALKEEGIRIDASGLIKFLKTAIEGREYAKFVFTRSVSEVLRLIKLMGVKYGLTVDDCSFLNISTILNLYATLDHRDLSKILKKESDRNRNFYEITRLIKLPSVITSPEDVYEFELEEGCPNYITLERTQGVVVREEDILKIQLSRKIVLISSADPGYDWIFSKNIGGLITMYGGANSHMAIRAAELKIPAIIGAGEKNYSTWRKARFLEIDCENKQVKILG